ncbi:hypothetical protein [Peribacillus sp. SCS-155]|uniref:hypothetical protein n=1 Tax=Peribacillus sedimenti TaxID=3115297 RepID=UPI00390627F3
MGSFFTNIQVYENDLSKIKQAILNKLSSDYKEALPGEDADRVILIKPSTNIWSTIYDQELDSQDLEQLYKLAKDISSELDASTVTILVHDSDALNMCLFDKGQTINNYWNVPDFLSDSLPEYKIKKLKGNPLLWKELLLEGYSAKNLKKIWRSPEIWPEDILQESAAYFGFNMEDCFLGYQDVNDGNKDWENYLEIKLKYTEDYVLRHPEATLPFLTMFSWKASIEEDLNKPCTVSFNFVNGGARSQGFSILLFGEAVENNLINFLETEIEFYSLDYYVEETIRGVFQETTTNSQSQKAYLCEFPEAFLPKGGFEQSPIMNVKCTGIINKLGEAELLGVIIPQTNQDQGQTGFSTVVRFKN